MLEPFIFLFNYRRILFRTSFSEIKKRYAGSFLGPLWIIIYPVLFLFVYSTVYIHIFKIKFNILNSNEYVLLMFCGLIPCLGFSEALGNCSGSITANTSLVKNTMFPIELLPVRNYLTTLFSQFVSIAILVIAVIYLGRASKIMPVFFLILFLQILFTTGIAWILSSLNVFIRDVQYIVNIAVFLLIILSPIAYTIDMIPAKLKFYLGLNPLFYFVVSYQEIMMFGRLPEAQILIVMSIFSLVSFFGGFFVFKRLKPAFPDYI